jgi:DNA-binding transcriptional LysR family regulator
MDDLNDLAFFAQVVEHGGFAAAERASGVPKSRLSRRVAELERRLGARLLQRSTRRFAVTDIGQQVYRHAQSMRLEAQAAREAVDQLSATPRGLVRLSCPVALAQQQIAAILPDFLRRYPAVRVQLLVSNRPVDVIGEGIDVALRVRDALTTDGDLVLRRFGHSRSLLVASGDYLDREGRPARPDELGQHAMLSLAEDGGRQRWTLQHGDGSEARVEFEARVGASDFPLLRRLAAEGLGIALLPEFICGPLLCDGQLERVLPEWELPLGICHAVFPSRRGLLPAVRVLIDHLAEQLPPLLAQIRRGCSDHPGLATPASQR